MPTEQTYPVYTVHADRETGEWTTEAETTGERRTMAEWLTYADTTAMHYDTYEVDGETRLVRVLWLSE